MAVGSDVKEVTYNHPTYGSGRILFKAGEDSTMVTGGVRRTNAVDGSGGTIGSMVAVPWSFEGTAVYDDNKQLDTETISNMAGSPEEATWTIAYLDGRIYTGKGTPDGDDTSFSGKDATFTLKISGGGKLSLLK